MELILNKIDSSKITLDLLRKEIMELMNNNIDSKNDAKIKDSIHIYDNLIDELNELIDEYEKITRVEAVQERYSKVANNAVAALTPAIGLHMFALARIQPVDNTGKSVNIPSKMSKWQH